MRLFLAINLPSDVRSAVWATAAPMRACAPELAWIDATRLHLTIKFLGEQPDERLSEIAETVARVAGEHRELGIELAGIGAFPNFRRARVVWMGVAQDAKLELLHHDIEVACETLGLEVEGRPFRPHITLARVAVAPPVETLRELHRVARRIDYRSEVAVRSIDVMQSDLSTAGPSYTMLASAALIGG